MPPTNPYSAGGMITDPKMFFGRDEELKRIRDRLGKGGSTSVVGLRRMGKSSLLYQLAHQTHQLPDGTLPVYLDLQDPAHQQPLGLLNAAWRVWQPRDHRPIDNLADFGTRIKQLNEQGYHPLLCLDEVEQLTERSVFDDDFFNGLRSLGNQGQLAFVTVSGAPLDILIKQGGRTSQFYNIFIHRDLGGLSDPAARELLAAPFHQAELAPPDGRIVAKILVLAGHYPFYLQMAAYHLFDQLKSGGDFNADFNAYDLREVFISEARRHFLGLWRSLDDEEQAGLERIVGLQGGVVRNWEETQARLSRIGLAEGEPLRLRLFSSVFAELVENRWLRQETARYLAYAPPPPSVVAEPEASPPPPAIVKPETSPPPPAVVEPESPESKSDPPPHPKPPATPLVYAYTLVVLASAVIAFFIAFLLPPDSFWPFFAILTVFLTFILVGVDKLTGSQFLEWLSSLLGKW